MTTVKEKYGFLPLSVMDFEAVPNKWALVHGLLDIHLVRKKEHFYRGEGSQDIFFNTVLFSKFSFGLTEFVTKFWSKPGDLIIDPFMGWGIRGVVAIELGRNYVGYDVSPEMYNKAVAYLDKIKNRERIDDTGLGNYNTHLSDGCGLEHTGKETVDLIFTCPPYWDVEKYESAPAQLSDCGSYGEFLTMLKVGFSNYYRVLKPEAFCIFVVADFRRNGFKVLHNDLMCIANESGFCTWDIIISVLRSPFVRTSMRNADKFKFTAKKHEYIIVFKKTTNPKMDFIDIEEKQLPARINGVDSKLFDV